MMGIILRTKDYPSIKNDIDIEKLTNVKFYIKKLNLISESNERHHKHMKEDAIKILKIFKREYSEYFI